MKVIGIGDNVVDKYLHLNKMFPGGNALNFTVYAKQLGTPASYIGVFGTDKAGHHVKKVMQQFGIDISHCRTYEGENGYAEVNLEDGDRVFVGSNGGGVSKQYPLELTQKDLQYIEEHDLIHSSCFSFLEGELHKLDKLTPPVSFDFSKNYDDDYLNEVCPHIDYAFLSCGHLSKKETEDKLKDVIEKGCELAVGTRGVKGAILLYNDQFYYQEAKKVEPIDTLGAGDSFITVILLEIIRNSEITEEVIKRGLKKAAEFASETCLVNGAFGHGKTIK
jgi:sugar/nucleoside kinase (ribokinase family)